MNRYVKDYTKHSTIINSNRKEINALKIWTILE